MIDEKLPYEIADTSIEQLVCEPKKNINKDTDLQNLEDKDKDADIKLKIAYGVIIAVVLLVWEAFVIWFFVMTIKNPISLVSDAVFITLLTTTTANMLALPAIVLKYLFPKKQTNKQPTQ